jgi:hypothetical protein
MVSSFSEVVPSEPSSVALQSGASGHPATLKEFNMKIKIIIDVELPNDISNDAMVEWLVKAQKVIKTALGYQVGRIVNFVLIPWEM